PNPDFEHLPFEQLPIEERRARFVRGDRKRRDKLKRIRRAALIGTEVVVSVLGCGGPLLVGQAEILYWTCVLPLAVSLGIANEADTKMERIKDSIRAMGGQP
ncbi:MAG: hypothetical protein ACREYF_08270, partial [Gammaproteobacteria bacterium]